MAAIRTISILLLIAVSLVGCHYPQSYASRDNLQQEQIPQEKLPQAREAQDKILFEGENIIVIESDQSNLEQFPFDAPINESCFRETDVKIRKKLLDLGFKSDTKYFIFEGQEKNSIEQKRFTLRLSKEQVAKINLGLMKEFDSQASNLNLNDLYFLKNNNHESLLMIGHNVGTSGYGHYYRVHILFPLEPNQSIFEFHSVTGDPRKISIDESGRIHYVQIDSKRLGAVTDVDSDDFPVTVSLFTYNGASHKKIEFDFDCRSLLDDP